LADTEFQNDDKDLAARILRGDGDAFAKLVEMHHPKIFRLVRGILGDWHRSEDVCQEVFLSAFRNLSSFRHRSRLSTWLYRVALNAALRARRRQARSTAEPLDALRGLEAPPDRDADRLEGDEVIRKLLAPLPDKLRIVVVLREQAGLSYEEMARVLGCSRGAVEQRLHRALVTLRQIWKDADGPWK
jgi:RNA polymerase sigma-70 factor (ECF subfamily)